MKTPMTDQLHRTLREKGDAFRQFSRNGRWGTCGCCPRDIQNNAYPEYCEFTERQDHHLSATSLAESWEIRFRGNAPKSGQNAKGDARRADA
jgi:hypothetical protein